MPLAIDDTIAAIATARGSGPRAVVRVAGPDVVENVGRFFESSAGEVLSAIRVATVIPGVCRLVGIAPPLPCELYLWPNNSSYTRSPLAELHAIGSPPLVEALLRTACRHGARLAEPGEFTLRAFLAGRLDLTQAEAVLGVIDARGSRQFGHGARAARRRT